MKTGYFDALRDSGDSRFPKFSFRLRSVQLDLARQMESVSFIKGYADFAASNGYNSLTLYLEGRIRTDSFPYPLKEESYSPEEIREIVAYAGTLGLEVVPVVSTLSHAELFLRYPELSHLAETRLPFSGRFKQSAVPEVFCPSLPATYVFFQKYLSEISALFSSPYFHVGCDEAWDMGCCDLCRQRMADGESLADIFFEHLLKVHAILTGELGKRMIIWDDMFEYYPEALESLPRDIILACWQYEDRVVPTRAHFLNRAAKGSVERYERLGFECLICPSDYTIENAASFTAYAAHCHPIGALMTQWEKKESFPLQNRPLIAAVGLMWQSGGDLGPQQALRQAIELLFGSTDPLFVSCVQAIFRSGIFLERKTRAEDYLTQRQNGHNYAREGLIAILLEIFPKYLDQVKADSRLILEELLLSLSSEQAYFQLRGLLPEFLEPDADVARLQASLEGIRSQIENIRDGRLAMWQYLRPEASNQPIVTLYAEYLNNLKNFSVAAPMQGFLRVHFLLPDQYSAQTVRLSIRYVGDQFPENVAEGVFKDTVNFDPFYSRTFPVARDKIPVCLVVETQGYGGQGFTWFEIHNASGHFVPEGVAIEEGLLTNPDHLLVQDWRWSFSGEQNSALAYHDVGVATGRHRFCVFMQLATDGRDQGTAKNGQTE